MNNIVIIGILFVFAIIIARVAWNNKLKYSYTDAELGAAKQENLKDLQQLTDAQVMAVEDSMLHAGKDIKAFLKERQKARPLSLSEFREMKDYVPEFEKKRKQARARLSSIKSIRE